MSSMAASGSRPRKSRLGRGDAGAGAGELAEAGVERFVGTGTCIEYDWSDREDAPEPGLRKESDNLAPTFLYGEAKATCYRLLSAAAPGLGLSFAWGRLFPPLGPQENPARLVASLIAAMRAGAAAEIGSGRQLRDFMSTQDAGAALAALCASGVTGAVNVASGEPVTVGALAQEIAGLLGDPTCFASVRAPTGPEKRPPCSRT